MLDDQEKRNEAVLTKNDGRWVAYFDIDGVLTDGKFTYSSLGKSFKRFSVDDGDALKILNRVLPVTLISADRRGASISGARARDLSLNFQLLSAQERLQEFQQAQDRSKVMYMGDGIFDGLIFKFVDYSIAPQDALDHTKAQADFVTSRIAGNRAVAEACLHLLDYLGFGSETMISQYFSGAKPS